MSYTLFTQDMFTLFLSKVLRDCRLMEQLTNASPALFTIDNKKIKLFVLVTQELASDDMLDSQLTF